MRKLKNILAIVCLLLISDIAGAMPSITGKPELRRPAGLNEPSRLIVNRDEPNLEGEWNCLVILIDFPDYTWENQNDSNFANQDNPYTAEHFGSMLFSEGEYRHPGATSDYTGSMRDYYSEISSGDFTTNGVATRWYRAPEPYTYYCNTDGQVGTPDDNGYGEYPANVQGLIEQAIQSADDDVDFSDYDNNGDGIVDALFIVHAGPGAEAIPGDAGVNYIWSHKWSIPGLQLDNVFISEYTIEPQDGTIGVFCHEFGHAIGLPDLYDTDGSSEGIGEWCLMGGGGWCARPGDPLGTSPSHMCAWSKSRLDWVTVTYVDGSLNDATVTPVETSAEVYRVWQDGDIGPEYFLVENRRHIGFDAGLTRRQIDYGFPAPEGLLILHIDETQWSNEDDAHRLVDVVEASGLSDDGLYVENLDRERTRPADRDLLNPNRGDDGDLWPGFNQTTENRELWQGDRVKNRFGFETTPSSNSYSGNPSFVAISNIHFSGENVVCDFDIVEPDQPILLAGEIEFSDVEEGNGDGFFEPGETASINIHIRNVGRQDASTVALSASYNGDLDVTVEPEGNVAYPDIPAHDERPGRTPFRVSLPMDAPTMGSIILQCAATCSFDTADFIQFPFLVELAIRPPHEWAKHPDNPVLYGTEGEWDGSAILGISTLMVDDTLKTWYIGGQAMDTSGVLGVGYAWSADGGENFTKNPEPVISGRLPDWASTGFQGLAVMQTRNGYLMMLLGIDIEDVATIGRATSQDGISWAVDEQPSIVAGGWAAELFPIGNLTLFFDGRVTHCGFASSLEQGPVALGTAYSVDLVHWQLAPQPALLPTMNAEDFDGFVCFSPDVALLPDGIKLLYGGFSMDFQGRLGLVDVGNDLSMERHRGMEAGGSILIADPEGWEAGAMLLGGRMFEWRGDKRILYIVAGENSGAIGLAVESGPMSAPPATDEPAPVPQSVHLTSAYPNPFNGSTVVGFSLPRSSDVKLVLYDLAGRMVVEQPLGIRDAGTHRVAFSASNSAGMISSGYYFLSVESSFGSAKRGVLLLK